MTAQTFRFQPRWKEELACSSALGTFVLEMPMGVVCVYFPTKSTWEREAPAWVSRDWATVLSQLQAWCQSNRIPLHVEDTARVYAE